MDESNSYGSWKMLPGLVVNDKKDKHIKERLILIKTALLVFSVVGGGLSGQKKQRHKSL